MVLLCRHLGDPGGEHRFVAFGRFSQQVRMLPKHVTAEKAREKPLCIELRHAGLASRQGFRTQCMQMAQRSVRMRVLPQQLLNFHPRMPGPDN